jgi:arylsulfatase
MMKLILLVSIFSFATSLFSAQRPNFVIIMVDDMGYSDIGCYGAAVIETPRLDQIASQGMKMRHFVNTGKCHSSRASLLAGLWCDQAGGASLKHAVVFPKVLKDAGYRTGMTGKWHLQKHPLDWGFEKYFGHLSGSTDFVGGNDTFRDGRKVFHDFGETAAEFYLTDVLTDHAIKYIHEWEKEDDTPFALYIAYNAPHSPLQAPEHLVRKYRGKFMEGWEANQKKRYANQLKLGVIDAGTRLPDWPEHHRKWSELSDREKSWEDFRRAIYAGMVESLDQNIGRLKDELVRKGEWDNTVFMFFSDNGGDSREINRNPYGLPWEAKYHVQVGLEWSGVSNTPFRWYKQNQHRGGISTPMIVSWPQGLKAHGWNDFSGHLVDIYPTLIDLAGTAYPEEIEPGVESIPLAGVSMRPVFEGNAVERQKAIYHKYASSKGITVGHMKLVSARSGPWELYDLKADPTELNDLSAQYPEKVKNLAEKWLEMARKDGNSAEDAAVNEKVAAWGTRSYSNGAKKAGAPNSAEFYPRWKKAPGVGLLQHK